MNGFIIRKKEYDTILDMEPSNISDKKIFNIGFIINVGLKKKKEVKTPTQKLVQRGQLINEPKKLGFILQKKFLIGLKILLCVIIIVIPIFTIK